MKKIIQTWIFPVTSAVVAALLPSPAAALSCDSTTDLVAQANSNEPPAVRDCTLASEKAIHLSATLHSENLVGARGTIVVRFFNQQGIQINQQGERIGRSEEAEDKIYGGPWFGGITGLAFDQTVVVPPNATKVHIWARAASFQDNAMGEWRVADLTVSPGVALVEAADPSLPAEGLPLFVRTTGRPQWRFFSVPGTAVGKFRMELLDMDGRLYAQEVASQSAVTFDFVNLPVGHYQARVRFIPGQGFAEGDAWKSTVAILPDGEPPKEPHFGIDAELSWYGGMPYMVERSAGLIRQAGIGTVRDRMSWNGVQPECTDVNWRGEWGNTNAYENITIDVGRTGAQSSPRYYDHTAQVVKDAGMDSVQVFHDSPACAHGGTTPLIGWPHAAEALSKAPIGRAGNDAAYKFGQEYAQRLGQTVRSIEFWNEQSTTSFYEGYPFQYASALKAFSDGIKSVDPGIRVLIGSSAREPGVFFDETYYNGTADFFDLHNHHNHSKTADLGVFAASIKTQEHNFNIHEKASWLTERGYVMEWDEWKSPAAPTTWYANGWQDAELEQARFLVRTYVSGFAAGYDRVFFFGWCELFEAAARGTWGIVHDDLSPRPAYVALALLTRHLAGAAVRSIEQHGEGRTVYFKKNNDNKWVAVTWGGGAAWNRLGTGVEIRDIFGKTLSIPEASGMTAPLLLSEIDASAANAGVPVGLPSETLRGRESSLRLAVTSLRIDGEEHVFSPSNGVDVPIGEGSTVEIVARPYTTGNTLATGVLGECAAGSGLVAQRPSAQIVNGELVCSFTAQPLRDRSYIMLRATKNGHSDVVRVALKADSATLVASPFLVNGQCPTWVPYKGSNVDPLVITEISAAPSCPWIKVESTILNGNQDSWVFPYVDFPTGTLAGKIGLRIQVEDAAVPAPLMIQLHESNGEAWLLSTTQLLKESEGVYSGLFSRATQPNWTPTRGNGVLNPEEVYKIMVGWSYTTSQAGAQHVYTIEEIELLSPNPVTGTPGTPSTPGTSGAPGASTGMALRDAIYLYRQPISGIATQASTLAAYNCDVFQMLLDVESGYTDVALLESEVASNAKVVYRDSIHATAPMFSYTLYAPMPVKTFTLGRFRGSVSTGGDIGTVTVFGYCFSTRADGKVLFHDGTGVCHLPSARAVSCPKVPEDDQW